MSRLDAVEENISGPKNMAVESMKNETEKNQSDFSPWCLQCPTNNEAELAMWTHWPCEGALALWLVTGSSLPTFCISQMCIRAL